MRILLTGMTGFIGSRVAPLLLEKGHEVAAIIRPNSNTWRCVNMLDKVFLIGDDLSSLRRRIGVYLSGSVRTFQPDVCMHLAWDTTPGSYVESEENVECLINSVELMKVLSDSGCKKILTAGTCFEYDHANEMAPLRIREEDFLDPTSMYGAAKLSLYHLSKQFCKNNDMEFVYPRIFYSYGPMADSMRTVSRIIESAIRNEGLVIRGRDQVRDFMYVDDIASALVAIAESKLTGAINVGGFTPTTIGGIVEMVAELTGNPAQVAYSDPLPDGEPPTIVADNSRLVMELGWLPSYSLREGLSKTIDWCRSQT